jgi:4-amino-4-deoxy-L-arabinose transferase-like glycosyltransferase
VTTKPAQLAFLLFLLTFAQAVRLHDITQPLVTFHPTRHYRSAVIARHCYYHADPRTPDWRVRVADANREMQPQGEPPLLEWLGAGLYLMLGHEDVAYPRALVALMWVLGAIPLYLLALRWSSPATAPVGVAVYLFLPYAIVASRNFQPDALMTLASLWALVGVARFFERPTNGRRLSVIALVALALLVKPMSVFLTIPVIVGLGIVRPRDAPRVSVWSVIVTAGLPLLPAVLYYGYSTLFGSFARDQMVMRFVPDLLTTSFFWGGLARQIGRVFTWPLFIISLLGIAFAPRIQARVVLAFLWSGYAIFAVAFTYHMPTHDYYHWPFIAAVALGVAGVAASVERVFADRVRPAVIQAVAVAGTVAIAVIGTSAAWPRLSVPSADAVVTAYREIGELTEHHTKVLFLDLAYGYPLMYHGELSGDSWPTSDDLAAEAIGGNPAITAQERFARDYAGFEPSYFVATDLPSLDAQPDLRALLKEKAVVVKQTSTYHVYRFAN